MARSYSRTPTMSRYIARAFARNIAVVLLGLLAILQIMDVIGESNRILQVAGNTEADLWRYVQLRLPILLSEFLPFTVLLATLITCGTLAASSQVVIMRSSGLSPHQVLLPMLAVAAVCACFHLVWNETISVHASARLAEWQATGYGAHPVDTSAQPTLTWVAAGDSVIRARPTAAENGGVSLTDIAIFGHVREGGLDTVTFAARGFLSSEGTGELEDVRTVDIISRDVRTVDHMTWQPAVTPQHFFVKTVNPDQMALLDLAATAHALAAVGREDHALQSEMYHKLARPLGSLLMPLLGTIVAVGLARTGSVLARASIGLALGFSYFVADNAIMAMGRSGAIPPQLAAWMAVLIFFVVGEAILFRTEQ